MIIKLLKDHWPRCTDTTTNSWATKSCQNFIFCFVSKTSSFVSEQKKVSICFLTCRWHTTTTKNRPKVFFRLWPLFGRNLSEGFGDAATLVFVGLEGRARAGWSSRGRRNFWAKSFRATDDCSMIIQRLPMPGRTLDLRLLGYWASLSMIILELLVGFRFAQN